MLPMILISNHSIDHTQIFEWNIGALEQNYPKTNNAEWDVSTMGLKTYSGCLMSPSPKGGIHSKRQSPLQRDPKTALGLSYILYLLKSSVLQ